MEDFSCLLLNPFPAALKFILGVLELHYPDFPILDGLLQLLVEILQDAIRQPSYTFASKPCLWCAYIISDRSLCSSMFAYREKKKTKK